MNDIASTPSLSARSAPAGRSVSEQLISNALIRPPESSYRAQTAFSGINGDARQSKTAASGSSAKPSSPSSTVELSPQAQKIVAELAARDREVRAHEAAHIAAGGGLAGGASYSYQTGPDGRRYAVGGEVSIDTSSTGNPEEDIVRAAAIRRAALAPAEPSGQDRSVAASATQMEIEARAALAAQSSEEASRSTAGGQDSAAASSSGVSPAAPANTSAQSAAAARAYAAVAGPSGAVVNIQA